VSQYAWLHEKKRKKFKLHKQNVGKRRITFQSPNSNEVFFGINMYV